MIPFPGTKNVINYNPISWDNVETDVSLTGINFSNSRNHIAFNANCRNFPMINNPGHGVYSADTLSSGRHKISTVLTYSSGKVRRLNLEVRAD